MESWLKEQQITTANPGWLAVFRNLATNELFFEEVVVWVLAKRFFEPTNHDERRQVEHGAEHDFYDMEIHGATCTDCGLEMCKTEELGGYRFLGYMRAGECPEEKSWWSEP
jgi:hypothetical protein